MKNQAIAQIEDLVTSADKAAFRNRQEFKETGSTRATQMEHYHNGRAVGANDAWKIMREELKRLQNRFQNGMLQVSDFEV